MTQKFFDPTLTQADIELTTLFMMELAADNKEYWSSDDFRVYRLDLAFNDPQHEIGTYFAKLKASGVAVPYGEVPSEIESNNKRKVDLWRFDWARWRSILRSRLSP
jgi:hypothetical protein